MGTKQSINAALKVLGIAGFSGLVIIAPNATQAFSLLMRRSPAKAAGSSRLLTELKRQGLVHIKATGNEYHYTLTPKGAHRLQQVVIDELFIEVPKKWDKRWRAVSFDIPVKFSRQRTGFVDRLQALGFVMLQKSLWVHPAPCFELVEQLAGHYNVMRYCTLFEIRKLDELATRKLFRHFFSS